MGILDDLAQQVGDDISSRASQGVSDGIDKGISKMFGKNEELGNKCSKCKKEIEDSSLKFCPDCGTKLLKNCPECGIDYPLDAKFCTQCGKQLK